MNVPFELITSVPLEAEVPVKVIRSPSRSAPVSIHERGESSLIVYPESVIVGRLLNRIIVTFTVPVAESPPL